MSQCEFTLLTWIVIFTVASIRMKAKQPSLSRSSSICLHGCCVCAAVLKMGGIDAGEGWIQEFSHLLRLSSASFHTMSMSSDMRVCFLEC